MMSHKNGWWLVIGCSLNAIHSRTRRLEWSLIRNPQSPKLPLYKRNPANSYKVTESREQYKEKKQVFFFYCRDVVTSAETKLQKKREQNQIKLFLFFIITVR